jgi:hypothetical protein
VPAPDGTLTGELHFCNSAGPKIGLAFFDGGAVSERSKTERLEGIKISRHVTRNSNGSYFNKSLATAQN